jgi:threonine dehydratase
VSDLSREDVIEARTRISGEVERSPLIESEINGRRMWLKAECLQTGGAFKLRGAANRLLQLTDEERARGVVAFSSGNHARGVAIIARRLGIRAIIVMPVDAPAVKIDGVRGEGAEIVFFDRRTESREAIAVRIATDLGATVVPSFDDERIVAGQGTVGLELAEQLEEMIANEPGTIVAPCGGGGLMAGIALACPEAKVHPVEPVGWDDMARSIETGKIETVPADAPNTLCDAIQTPQVSPITLAILRKRGAIGLSVTDAEVEDAIRFAWDRHDLKVEPGGAVALAAALHGKFEPEGETVILLSGGNIDPALHARITSQAIRDL